MAATSMEIKNSINSDANDIKPYNRKEYLRQSKKARMMKKFQSVKSIVQGAYVVIRNRSLEDLDGKYYDSIPDGYLRISHGVLAIQDASTQEIVCVVKCLPFHEMEEDEFNEYEKITSTLTRMKSGASHVTSNRPLKTGNMYAVGWRAGTDFKTTFSHYAPSPSAQKNLGSLTEWQQQQEFLHEVSLIYGNKFSELALFLFKKIEMETLNTGVPSLSDLKFKFSKKDEGTFCSNLTFTINDFSNKFHLDKDYQSYAFGIWAPIFSNTGKLRSKENGFECTGGAFLLGNYKVSVDFSNCDGIVQIIWRSKDDFHCTIPSKSNCNSTRLGTSVQVSNSLVQRVQKLRIEHAEGKKVCRRIRGVEEWMKLKEKKLKNKTK